MEARSLRRDLQTRQPIHCYHCPETLVGTSRHGGSTLNLRVIGDPASEGQGFGKSPFDFGGRPDHLLHDDRVSSLTPQIDFARRHFVFRARPSSELTPLQRKGFDLQRGKHGTAERDSVRQ